MAEGEDPDEVSPTQVDVGKEEYLGLALYGQAVLAVSIAQQHQTVERALGCCFQLDKLILLAPVEEAGNE